MDAGYVTREFRVTWESAVALIDRGVPFTLTTVEPTSAHLQACIGYDSLRGTLLIRDPFLPMFSEFVAEPLFERYKSSGPRGMAIAPMAQAGLLDGVDLPDADAYDAFHSLQRSLVRHARADAGDAYGRMAQRWPGHRMRLVARRTLASYDGNTIDELAATEALLGLFPADQGLTLFKLGLLRTLGRREERVRLLREMAAMPRADGVFRSRLAHELQNDSRQHPEAIRLLRRTLRSMRLDAGSYAVLAGVLWESLRREQSLTLYRFATSLDEKNSSFARSWFVACRYFKWADEAIALLRRRFDRAGRRSAQPAFMLAWAYEELKLPGEAIAAIDAALALRPDDSDLLLLAANYHARYGGFDKAEAFLERRGTSAGPAHTYALRPKSPSSAAIPPGPWHCGNRCSSMSRWRWTRTAGRRGCWPSNRAGRPR